MDETEKFIDYEDKIAKLDGLKINQSAMSACGMQPEFAAHLMQQCNAMGVSVILRAGSPPVYNQKRGPKTGFTLSKTSTQGLFKGSLAKDVRFTRVVPVIDPRTNKTIGRKTIGHVEKDEKHLLLSPKNPDYLHTVPLTVTMQDVLKELGPDGDLKVLGYDGDLLRLAYKEGKGDPQFRGQFLINLARTDKTPIFYSRPWDKPENNPDWDSEHRIIKKPDSLMMVPDDIYRSAFDGLMVLSFTETQAATPSEEDMKPALVFSNTPRTAFELKAAISSSGVLTPVELIGAILSSSVLDESGPAYNKIRTMSLESSIDEVLDLLFEGIIAKPPDTLIKKILSVLTEQQIRDIYDRVGLITTGDWDGLALGEPINLKNDFCDPEKLRVYNTFSHDDPEGEIAGLLEASCEYFYYLKELSEIQTTPFGKLINSIDDPVILFSEFSLARAGCITPHEFVYQQLINYSYRDQVNAAYGNDQGRRAMQNAMNAALSLNQSIFSLDKEQRFAQCQKIAMDTYLANVDDTYVGEWRNLDKEHLVKHLMRALDENVTFYQIPDINHDHNVHDLFQHGFDMRNPYGSNLEGAWLMVTSNGLIVHGDTEEQLVEVLLTEGFLEKNLITVSHGANMSAGWDRVIERQIQLAQPIPEKTMEKWINEGRMNIKARIDTQTRAKSALLTLHGESKDTVLDDDNQRKISTRDH